MKRSTKMMWAAVAVFGLYSPVFTHAASPFGGNSLKGGMARVGQSGGSYSQGSMKSMPSASRLSGNMTKSTPVMKSGGLNTQVLKSPIGNQNLGNKLGNRGVTKVGPIVQLPGNKLPGGSKTPIIKPFPGGTITPIKDPIRVTPFPFPGNGGKPPILDPGNGTKPPKKPPIFDPFPGGKPPVLDPGNGGKPPKKPPVFDPFPGGKPPVLDPGNGNNPPGGGNNPPGGGNNPPGGGGNGGGNGGNGGGNGGGHGHGNGHGHGHHHGGGKYWWPNYCLNWWWPTYYTQPYCGTVYVNGCWTYVTQPVAVEQISLVQVGESLPEIPSNATFRMQVAGLGQAKGLAAVEINGVGMQAEVLEWNADSVVVRLPAVGLTDAKVSDLYILQSDGSMAKSLKFKMIPALETAVAMSN